MTTPPHRREDCGGEKIPPYARVCHLCGAETESQLWQNRSRWKNGIPLLAFAAIWNAGLYPGIFIGIVTGEMPRFAIFVFELFALVGLVLLCAAFYFIFRRRVTLRDSSQGAIWQRESVFGVRTWQRVVARGEVMALGVELPQKLLSPPSIAALAPQPSRAAGKPKDEVLAVNVAGAALLGLLAQGVLEAHRTKIYTTTGNRGDGYIDPPSSFGEIFRNISSMFVAHNHVAYLIAPSDVTSHSIVEGTLEGRILELVRNWLTSSHAQDWPFPPTIYLLVQAIFEKDYIHPERWLLDLVREEAVASGLFTRQQRGWMRGTLYEPASLSAHHLIAEGEAMRVRRERAAQQQPEFASALEKEIRSAISSRVTVVHTRLSFR